MRISTEKIGRDDDSSEKSIEIKGEILIRSSSRDHEEKEANEIEEGTSRDLVLGG